MEVLHNKDDRKGFFYVMQEDEILARMDYVWAGTDRIIIEHTAVSDKLRGKGAGKKMVEAAVDFAREGGIKIVPLCPFAKSVFEKVPAYSDVL